MPLQKDEPGAGLHRRLGYISHAWPAVLSIGIAGLRAVHGSGAERPAYSLSNAPLSFGGACIGTMETLPSSLPEVMGGMGR